jgi:hypothetical protein
LNPEERQNMIQILILRTGWAQIAFDNMTDEQVEKIYFERVEMDG